MQVSITKERPILVTGASGYLASWIIKFLLETGHTVRGTVRSLASKDKYEKLLGLENAKENLQLVQADLTDPKGWDEAVSGCDYVFHTASPLFGQDPPDQNLFIQPAVNGTRYVAEAAIKHKVKRLVFTSSCITITANEPNGDYDDDHWADINKISFYSKSKWLAEKALWDLHKKQEGSEHKTEMVVIMPSLIFGPTVVSNTKTLSYSEEVIASFLKGCFPGIPNPDIQHRTADVRDVAKAQIKAMFQPNVDGVRIAVTNEVVSCTRIFDIIKKHFPTIKVKENQATAEELKACGNPFIVRYVGNMGRHYTIDNSRSKNLLKIEYTPFETSFVEMGQQMMVNGLF